jgi:hypothetical protein
MKLSAALVACNENPAYLEFWPIVKYAWWHVVGIPAIMVYVGETVPEDLKNDPCVIHFPPVEGWPTATQAQVIRLLYPALLQADGAVVISDMDIIPMQKDFFVDGFAKFREDQFVSLRGVDDEEKQVYMCYVGATPEIWRKMFQVESADDVRRYITAMRDGISSSGMRGGKGWFTDQLILYDRVKEWQGRDDDSLGLISLQPEGTFHRLDRAAPDVWETVSEELLTQVKQKYYIDFHMPHLYQCVGQIQMLLDTIRQSTKKSLVE